MMTQRAHMAPAVLPAVARRVAFVVSSRQSAAEMHASMFTAMAALGHSVICVAPVGDETNPKFDCDHIEFADYDPAPEGWGFLQSRRAVKALSQTLSDARAHIVVAAGPKISLLAAEAAQHAGIEQRISIVTERSTSTGASNATHWRKTFAANTRAIFFNRDDWQNAAKAGALPAQLPVSIVPGSGVDLQARTALPLAGAGDGLVVFLDSSRRAGTWAKAGIEVATALTAAYPHVSVIVTGRHVTGDQKLPPRVEKISGDSSSFFASLARCHLYVYVPGQEAMPARVLDALAAGRPVITSNVPGCRDTVDDLVNGCVIEPESTAALLAAVAIFVDQPDLIRSAAAASRLKAERRFDARVINQAWLKALTLTA